MQWDDIGGYSRAQHIVTSSSYGNYVNVMCGANITFAFYVERRRPLPRCRKCIILFQKLSDKLLKED